MAKRWFFYEKHISFEWTNTVHKLTIIKEDLKIKLRKHIICYRKLLVRMYDYYISILVSVLPTTIFIERIIYKNNLEVMMKVFIMNHECFLYLLTIHPIRIIHFHSYIPLSTSLFIPYTLNEILIRGHLSHWSTRLSSPIESRIAPFSNLETQTMGTDGSSFRSHPQTHIARIRTLSLISKINIMGQT